MAWQWVAAIALAVLGLAERGYGQRESDRLPCVAGGEHLWFIMPGKKPGPAFEICHQATDLPGAFYKAQGGLDPQPEQIASWDNRLWLCLSAGKGTDGSIGGGQRDVFTMQVEKEPTLGMYFSIPSGRLDIAAPLPGLGKLAAFSGSPSGPVALLLPYQRSGAGVTGGGHSAAAEPQMTSPHLLQLQKNQWVALDLPEGFNASGPVFLVIDGAGRSMTLLTGGSLPAVSKRHDRDAAGRWQSSEVDLDISLVRSLVAVGEQIAVVAIDRNSGEIVVGYLRQSRVVPLARLPEPAGAWSVVGLGNRPVLLASTREGKIIQQDIHPLTGVTDLSRTLAVQPITAGRLWQVSLLLAFAVSGMLLVFIIRPVAKTAIAIPAGLEVAPMTVRLSALAIDVFPAAVLTMLILQSSLMEILTTPMLTIDLEQSVPYFMVVGIAMAHSMTSELVWGTTLGKRLMGISIIAADGSAAPRRMLLLRNLLKAIVLLVPPLAVFAAINPYLQGLPELASRMVVVHPARDSATE